MGQQHTEKRFAPDIWSTLCRQLEQACESPANSPACVNAKRVGNNEIRLKNPQSAAWVRVSFDPHTPLIWYQTPGSNGYFVFRVKEDGNGVVVKDRKKGASLFVDEVADRLIELVA